MGYYPELELETLNLHELKQRFEQQEIAVEYDDIYYEELVKYILAQGASGLSYLKDIIEVAQIDVLQLRATICMLSFQPEEPWYRERLKTLLQDSRERIVAEAVDSLARMNAHDLSENVLSLLTHPSPYVRGSVLRYMRKLFPQEAPPLLITALKDTHPIVQENAIDELGELGYYQALPNIRPFLYNQAEALC